MCPHNAFHVAGNELYFGPWCFAHLPDYTQLPASVRDELVEALLQANVHETHVLIWMPKDDHPAPAA